MQRFAVTGAGDDAKKVDLLEKVFVELAARFKDRPGGYTRIIKVGNRRGDNAPISIIELVSGDAKAEKPAKAAAAAPAAEEKPKAAKKAPKAKPAAEGDEK